MKTIKEIIREGALKNQEELTKELLGLDDVKRIMENNKGFKFKIEFDYDSNNSLLVYYRFYKTETEDETCVRILLYDDSSFCNNAIDLSVVLIKYFSAYFNNEEYKIIVEDEEGKYELNLKNYIQSQVSEFNEKADISADDCKKDIELF